MKRRHQGMTRDELLAHVRSRSVIVESGCWLWAGALVNGYARMAWGRQKSGTVTRFLLGLEPGDPREALHSCDASNCVNPEHVSIGTHAENQAQMARRGRAARGPRPTRARRVPPSRQWLEWVAR